MSRDAAARKARQAVDAGWTRLAFAKRAKLDVGTVSDFLDGNRWPQGQTRARIEKALDWEVGTLQDIADGTLDPDDVGRPDEGGFVAAPGGRSRGPTLTDDEVLALIRENRRLADELERRIKGGGP